MELFITSITLFSIVATVCITAHAICTNPGWLDYQRKKLEAESNERLRQYVAWLASAPGGES